MRLHVPSARFLHPQTRLWVVLVTQLCVYMQTAQSICCLPTETQSVCNIELGETARARSAYRRGSVSIALDQPT